MEKQHRCYKSDDQQKSDDDHVEYNTALAPFIPQKFNTALGLCNAGLGQALLFHDGFDNGAGVSLLVQLKCADVKKTSCSMGGLLSILKNKPLTVSIEKKHR